MDSQQAAHILKEFGAVLTSVSCVPAIQPEISLCALLSAYGQLLMPTLH
jgi:hypothetical protein